MWSFARCVCVCLCVREREGHSVVCVCVCERERERETSQHVSSLTVASVQTHTSIITVSVTRLCSPLGIELMVKLRTLLTVFTFILKAKACDYGKGRYIF